ncbi:hypothetical protein NHX12_032380 [Muraenolepis orangiensis]|uniref:Uncharacterized protein n=1 Tax=Muraenolepis orangiensis TaxID=630683 RepID=A0A9Q0IJP2_9TELE|nr:hypothetical protein NHX12_031431 [Muraenolepis orangiensis]KAJ3600449.1 hypothetical protein NHX12_031432 [Muraenolepis orangiensis]KAJ3601412.1 hypothetical protein NHX12_032380 [Muraenolepis orangiensis]
MLNWILTLVLLCSAVGSVRSCDWLRIYGDLSNDSMSLLDQMVTANKLRAKRTHTEADTQTHLKLSHYYKKLFRSTVHKMGGSVASWELIRKESKVHLEMLDLLQVTIPRPAKSG